MSRKREERLRAAGVFPSSTLVSPRSPAAPVRLPAVRQSTGPDQLTVDAVLERDCWSCVVCGGGLWGNRGWDWSVGHRRPRRIGGDPRPETNGPANLVILHGSGTTGCHGAVESMRTQSEELGWLLHAEYIPAEHPIQHALHGWVLLDDAGGWRPTT
jgi:hypothetical protein